MKNRGGVYQLNGQSRTWCEWAEQNGKIARWHGVKKVYSENKFAGRDMKKLDLESESQKWEHPYRIQVSKPLRRREIGSLIEDLTAQGINCAVEKKGGKFVVWREPEQGWDMNEASPEWIQEWTSQKPPPMKAFIGFVTINGKEKIMPITDNRFRRDEAIRAEFAEYKRQGFQSGHIYRVLAEKFYLSPHRVRDIVVLTREKRQKPPK